MSKSPIIISKLFFAFSSFKLKHYSSQQCNINASLEQNIKQLFLDGQKGSDTLAVVFLSKIRIPISCLKNIPQFISV
jgi:hypothetical protein